MTTEDEIEEQKIKALQAKIKLAALTRTSLTLNPEEVEQLSRGLDSMSKFFSALMEMSTAHVGEHCTDPMCPVHGNPLGGRSARGAA